jgi:hypothetical protein
MSIKVYNFRNLRGLWNLGLSKVNDEWEGKTMAFLKKIKQSLGHNFELAIANWKPTISI